MKEDQELLETEASTMRRHQSMQRLSRGELVDSHMDEELVRIYEVHSRLDISHHTKAY